MKSPTEILTWSLANIIQAEAICDQAANLTAAPAATASEPFTYPEPPTLVDFADRELESQLLGCLQVRSGGLDPKTPSRTREWLWNGLSGLLTDEVSEEEKASPAPAADNQGGVSGGGTGAADDDDDETIALDDATEPLVETGAAAK